MTDEQIERLARTHLTAGDDGEIFGVVKFARALLSASIADTAGAKAVAYEVHWPNGEHELIYASALRMISDLGDFTLTELYAAPPAPSVADAAGAMLVPLEPTEEMMRAVRHLDWSSPTDVDWDEGYRAMIAAAPAIAPAPSVADAAGASEGQAVIDCGECACLPGICDKEEALKPAGYVIPQRLQSDDPVISLYRKPEGGARKPLYTHPSAELTALRERIAGLEAARIAYASEFPLDEEGLPDVDIIHQNIRELKVRIAGMEKDAERLDWLIVNIKRHRLYEHKGHWFCPPVFAQDWQPGHKSARDAIDAAIAKEPKQ